MKEVESRTYAAILQSSRGTMCAECREAVPCGSPVVKEALGYEYRYVHPLCYRSLPCLSLISPIVSTLNQDLQALAQAYERHIANYLPIRALTFTKRCSFPHSPRERIYLEILKFLSLVDKVNCGFVCRAWYEVSWNEELWPAAVSMTPSLRISALEEYLNHCKECGGELHSKSAFLVAEHIHRGYCKSCYSEGLRPVSLKVLQQSLNLTAAFLSDLHLPIIAVIGSQSFTLLQAFRSRIRRHAKSLLHPICAQLSENHCQMAVKMTEEMKKKVCIRASAVLMKDMFPCELVLEVSRKWGLEEEMMQELLRILYLA